MAKINKKSNTAKKNKENIGTYKIYPELYAVFDVFLKNGSIVLPYHFHLPSIIQSQEKDLFRKNFTQEIAVLRLFQIFFVTLHSKNRNVHRSASD